MAMDFLKQLQVKLFKLQSDGLEPFVLGQRRVFILPSKAGFGFAVLLLAMLTGAINYSLSLGHALVFLLAGIGLTGMIHTFRNLHGLGIACARCEPVFAGQIAHFPLLIDNPSTRPRPALVLEAAPTFPVSFALAELGQQRVMVPVPTAQRGWLALPRTRLSTRYPLGLFTAWAYLAPASRCLVYPEPRFSPLPENYSSVSGGGIQGEQGQEDFAGFRERQTADSLRHVAWKVDARLGEQLPLYVKTFAGGGQSEQVLDWRQTDPNTDRELRLGQLTGWVIQANKQGLRYTLRVGGRQIGPDSGSAHLKHCLEVLALISP